MADNAILIFVSAGNCGGCVRFKQFFWDKTKAELGKMGLRVVEVPVPKIGDPIPDNHSDLSRFIAWYPTFILVTKSSYDAKKGKLSGVVFNGIEGKTKWDLDPKSRQATDDVSIVKWVNDQLGTNPIFKKGVMFGPLGVKGILKSSRVEREINSDSDDGESYLSTYCQQAFVPFS